MFTGIVATVGEVARVEAVAGDLRLWVRSAALDLGDVALGDSIATNGVCLTVTALERDGFRADVSRETLAHTTLEHWRAGQRVNLEKALRASDRLGGHLVSGHVDGVAVVEACGRDARSLRLRLRAPEALARYIARKGSVAIDGVSLTVNVVAGACFELNIVPHSAERTIIAGYRPGQTVNLEVDVIARYLERLLQSGVEPAATGSGISAAWLAEHGFHS